MKTHELKTRPRFFNQIAEGKKTFEIRMSRLHGESCRGTGRIPKPKEGECDCWPEHDAWGDHKHEEDCATCQPPKNKEGE